MIGEDSTNGGERQVHEPARPAALQNLLPRDSFNYRITQTGEQQSAGRKAYKESKQNAAGSWQQE